MLTILLTACQKSTQIKPTVAVDLLSLDHHSAYQFNGKMSFSDGQDGGTGRVTWQSNQGLIDASLKAPLGSQSWQLIESVQGATLIANGGDQLHSVDAGWLISQQLGWQVPWQALKHWVVAQPHQTQAARVQWQGDALTIEEAGWRIEYSKFKPYPGGSLPHKMVARKGEYAIKLAVRNWQW
ncbi:lipoprotein insertase outer membrane protein LolB [Marinicella meishanensis]|uniref:lipoprotein insertase outer membrane protein LolB n=1 Tax=Marinicella meishanensis TaxID=2873263 RepID=UPI0021034D7B|nr:lipoprotein insertase outer membrane protein LolB [Marinicella sp. NBU2979]